MLSRKTSFLTPQATSPALAFAEAADHAKRRLAENLRSAPQLAVVLEVDGPFSLFADADPSAAAPLHDELHRRLSAIAMTVIALDAFRFVAISTVASTDAASHLARAIVETTAEPFRVENRTTVLTAVAGAIFAPRGEDAVAVLHRCAGTLNEARRRGRRLLMGHEFVGTYIAPPQLAAGIDQLNWALAEGRLRLALQPIVAARTRRVLHHEALLRVVGEDGVIWSAAELIVIAETLDLAYKVDLAVLDMAAATLTQQPELRLAINVSAASARDAGHAARWLERLAMLGETARRVTVELTETAAPDDAGGVLSGFARSVRKLGGRFSLDDFGSGYTSFRNILALRPDEVKIDGSFVHELRRDPCGPAFVKAVVDMAHGLGIHTVAEWVETEEDAKCLSRLGVDALQGFHLGRPAVDGQEDAPVKLRA